MRRIATLIVLLAATASWSLSSISAYKTFTREILTSDDLNQSFSTVISGVNNLIALHPGDSTKTTYGVFDSLIANPGPNIVVLDPLTSKSADDSLNFHIVHGQRTNTDTLQVGSGALAVAITAGSSAASGAQWGIPHLDADTINVTGPFTATGQAVFSGVSSILMPGALTFASGTDGYVLTSDGNGRVALEANPGATADTDSTLSNAGGSTVALRVDENGDVILTATASVDFSAGTSVALPAGLSIPSGSDGDVLTSDGNGNLALETPAAVVAVQTTLLDDTTRIALVDTTITAASVSVIEAYSLNSPKDMQDIGKFRMKEIATSLRDSLGLWPVNFLVSITTAQDCVVVWNRGSGGLVKEHLTITFGADNATGVHFLSSNGDAKLRISTSVGLYELDISNDKLWLYDTGGKKATGADLASDLALGTDAVTFAVVSAALALDDDSILDIDAIRNPFDPDEYLWVVGNATTTGSIYNSMLNGVFDQSTSADPYSMVRFSSKGGLYVNRQLGGPDIMHLFRSALVMSADGGGGYVGADNLLWWNGQSGASDLAWANPGLFSDIAVLSGQGIAGGNHDMVALASSANGMYLIHPNVNGDQASNGGKVLINDTAQYPYEKGASSGAFYMGGLTDGSPTADDLTENGTGAFKAGPGYVFSHAYSPIATSTLTNVNVAHNDPRSIHGWVKFSTKPSAITYTHTLRDEQGANDVNFGLAITTDGYAASNLLAGGASDYIAAAVDLSDGEWHHLASAWDYDADDHHLYVDGELQVSDLSVSVAEGAVDTDTLYVGCRYITGACASYFPGLLGPFAVSGDHLTPDEVKKIYDAGIASMQVPAPMLDGLDAAAVVAVKCIDEGWCASASVDSATVWKYVAPHLIPWKRYIGPGSGSITDVAIWWDGGADSLALAIGTDADLQLIQPDPNIYAAAMYRNPWVQPLAMVGTAVYVDSSGQLGVFWEIDDAIDAGANANRRFIRLSADTFPPFTADQGHMRISGSGKGSPGGAVAATFINNDNETGSIPIYITASQVTIDNLDVRSLPGGEGGGKNAVHISGTHAHLFNIRVSSADQRGIQTDANWLNIHDIESFSADSEAIYMAGPTADIRINGVYINTTGADGIYIEAGAENNIVDGNRITGWTGECIDDDSGTSVLGDNDCT